MPFEWGKKQNFKNHEPVVIYNLDSSGTTYEGIIRGKSFLHFIDSYIVELTPESKARIYSMGHRSDHLKHDPDGDEFDCISLTEACLKRPGE